MVFRWSCCNPCSPLVGVGRGVPMDFLVDVSCSRKGEIEVNECVENPCKGSVRI